MGPLQKGLNFARRLTAMPDAVVAGHGVGVRATMGRAVAHAASGSSRQIFTPSYNELGKVS